MRARSSIPLSRRISLYIRDMRREETGFKSSLKGRAAGSRSVSEGPSSLSFPLLSQRYSNFSKLFNAVLVCTPGVCTIIQLVWKAGRTCGSSSFSPENYCEASTWRAVAGRHIDTTAKYDVTQRAGIVLSVPCGTSQPPHMI